MTGDLAPIIGANIKAARSSARFSQAALARRSGVSRTQIVKMEAGQTVPPLDEAMRIADVLRVPIQQLLTGKDSPPSDLKGIAHELYQLGIHDLVVSDAVVPGAFRRAEQIIAIALRGDRPEVRILEAMPYVLSRQRIHVKLALAFAELYDPRIRTRLAWLSDVALALSRLGSLSLTPEIESSLERITRVVKKPKNPDGLGNPGEGPHSPVWKRWNVSYSGDMASFKDRVKKLSADVRITAIRLTGASREETLDRVGKLQNEIDEVTTSHTREEFDDLKRRIGIVEGGNKAATAKRLAAKAAGKLPEKDTKQTDAEE